MAPVYIEVLTSPNCPYSPRAMKVAKDVAKREGCPVVLREISVATSEGEDIANEYNIEATPTIAINGKVAFVGVPSSRVLKELVSEEFDKERRIGRSYF